MPFLDNPTRRNVRSLVMRLRWESPNQGLARGFSPEGVELAQVAHIHSPTGDDLGWVVWLTLEQGELFDQFPTITAARAAAEQALDPPSEH